MSSASPGAAVSEFDLIRRHFTRSTTHTELAIGDDAALVRARPGMQLAVSTDMLVCGTHFLADTDPEDLGWKTLAVNVSDLAAMGAAPRWVVLAASLLAFGFILPAQAASVSKTYSYFSVGGTTLEQLEAELSLRGPQVSSTGRRHPGATQM